jgi:phosphoribosylformylglycinamidine synthase PurS subunit
VNNDAERGKIQCLLQCENAPRPEISRVARKFLAKFFCASMKAKIIITPKKAVLDPQGKTVQTALEHMGYTGVTGVHIGKYIEIDLAPGTDKAAAEKALNEAAHKLLSNPVIEDYKLEIE